MERKGTETKRGGVGTFYQGQRDSLPPRSAILVPGHASDPHPLENHHPLKEKRRSEREREKEQAGKGWQGGQSD